MKEIKWHSFIQQSSNPQSSSLVQVNSLVVVDSHSFVRTSSQFPVVFVFVFLCFCVSVFVTMTSINVPVHMRKKFRQISQPTGNVTTVGQMWTTLKTGLSDITVTDNEDALYNNILDIIDKLMTLTSEIACNLYLTEPVSDDKTSSDWARMLTSLFKEHEKAYPNDILCTHVGKDDNHLDLTVGMVDYYMTAQAYATAGLVSYFMAVTMYCHLNTFPDKLAGSSQDYLQTLESAVENSNISAVVHALKAIRSDSNSPVHIAFTYVSRALKANRNPFEPRKRPPHLPPTSPDIMVQNPMGSTGIPLECTTSPKKSMIMSLFNALYNKG